MSNALSNYFSQVFLLFRQMPSLTLLGVLYQDDKHTIEDLTHFFAPYPTLPKKKEKKNQSPGKAN